jgi:hypothetical protein
MQGLAAQKLMRAIDSDRQLEEVLFDFWFNHFNVFAGKGRTSMFLVDYEREAIRPHTWGSLRDLLGATAKSPAMLFYLDKWLSADPEAAQRAADMPTRRRARQGGAPAAPPPVAQAGGRRRGLNENYARSRRCGPCAPSAPPTGRRAASSIQRRHSAGRCRRLRASRRRTSVSRSPSQNRVDGITT